MMRNCSLRVTPYLKRKASDEAILTALRQGRRKFFPALAQEADRFGACDPLDTLELRCNTEAPRVF
jgi:hypothetical protein